MPQGIGLYDVVINLAGAGIMDKKWTDEYKDIILQSRINSTRACVNTLTVIPIHQNYSSPLLL